jgi:hypothetical protein
MQPSLGLCAGTAAQLLGIAESGFNASSLVIRLSDADCDDAWQLIPSAPVVLQGKDVLIKGSSGGAGDSKARLDLAWAAGSIVLAPGEDGVADDDGYTETKKAFIPYLYMLSDAYGTLFMSACYPPSPAFQGQACI